MKIYLFSVFHANKSGVLASECLFDRLCLKARSMPKAREKAVSLLESAGLRNFVDYGEFWNLNDTKRKDIAFIWQLEEVTPPAYLKVNHCTETYEEELIHNMKSTEARIRKLQQEQDFWRHQLESFANPI